MRSVDGSRDGVIDDESGRIHVPTPVIQAVMDEEGKPIKKYPISLSRASTKKPY